MSFLATGKTHLPDLQPPLFSSWKHRVDIAKHIQIIFTRQQWCKLYNKQKAYDFSWCKIIEEFDPHSEHLYSKQEFRFRKDNKAHISFHPFGGIVEFPFRKRKTQKSSSTSLVCSSSSIRSWIRSVQSSVASHSSAFQNWVHNSSLPLGGVLWAWPTASLLVHVHMAQLQFSHNTAVLGAVLAFACMETKHVTKQPRRPHNFIHALRWHCRQLWNSGESNAVRQTKC